MQQVLEAVLAADVAAGVVHHEHAGHVALVAEADAGGHHAGEPFFVDGLVERTTGRHGGIQFFTGAGQDGVLVLDQFAFLGGHLETQGQEEKEEGVFHGA